MRSSIIKKLAFRSGSGFWISPDNIIFPVQDSHTAWIPENINVINKYFQSPLDIGNPYQIFLEMLNQGWVRLRLEYDDTINDKFISDMTLVDKERLTTLPEFIKDLIDESQGILLVYFDGSQEEISKAEAEKWIGYNNTKVAKLKVFTKKAYSTDLKFLNFEIDYLFEQNKYDLFKRLKTYFMLDVIVDSSDIDLQTRQAIKSKMAEYAPRLKQEISDILSRWLERHTSGEKLLELDEYINGDPESTLAVNFVEHGNMTWFKNQEPITIEIYQPAAKLLQKWIKESNDQDEIDYFTMVADELTYGKQDTWKEFLNEQTRLKIVTELAPWIFNKWKAIWGKLLQKPTKDITLALKNLQQAPVNELAGAISMALNAKHVHGKMFDHADLTEDELKELSNIPTSEINALVQKIVQPDYEHA